MPTNRKPQEAAVLSLLFWFFGYLYWGWLQAAAVLLAGVVGTFLFGVFAGFHFEYFLGWGKWVFWAALAAYHWRADNRNKAIAESAARAMQANGWLTDADKTLVQRESRLHFARTSFWEFGFCYFCALGLGALMAYDDNSAILQAFLASSLWNKYLLACGVLGGLALIGTVALFAWHSLTASLEQMLARRLAKLLKGNR